MWIAQTGLVPAAAQSPHQRVNTDPGAGEAVIVNVMMSPWIRQAVWQTVPGGLTVTVPAPVPPTAAIM
jgi:hypothetical protein